MQRNEHAVEQLRGVNAQGRELIAHGTVAFPAETYEGVLNEIELVAHWHDDLELAWIVRGACTAMGGSHAFVMSEGQGYFVNAGVLHTMVPHGDDACVYKSIVFHPRLIAGTVDSVFWQKYVGPVLENQSLKFLELSAHEKWHEGVLGAAEQAFEICRGRDDGFEFGVRDALSRLMLILARSCPEGLSTPSKKAIRDEARVKKMIEFVQANFGEDLSTELLARQVAVSESECLRCFRATIGTTPMQYVRDVRLRRAADYLVRTDLAAGDIGTQCGFADPSYFARSFRSWSGMSPLEYRKKARMASDEGALA